MFYGIVFTVILLGFVCRKGDNEVGISTLVSIATKVRTCEQCVWCVFFCMDSRDVIKRLKREGWYLVDTRGSHHQFKHPSRPGRVTVPHPREDIPAGTLKSIARQAGWE